MYESYFGLRREPFSIAPDPAFLYLGPKHRDALALLKVGLERGASFVLLTGEIGAGKTTVWRRFLEELPSNVDVASVVNPRLDVTALLARICDDLRIELPDRGAGVDLIDALHGHLLLAHAQGRRTLIVIDEAQALSLDVLEQLRLLTNLDTSGRKLQIMLIGQPELRQILARPELEPLAQRIVARFHLPALAEAETGAYVEHRLRVAGLTGPLPFDGESIGIVHRASHGVPRRINTICDRALAAAHKAGRQRVDRALAARAVAEVRGDGDAAMAVSASRARWAWLGAAALVVLAAAWWSRQPMRIGSAPQTPQTPQTAAIGQAARTAPMPPGPLPAPATTAVVAGAVAPAQAVTPALAPAPLQRGIETALIGDAAAWPALAARWNAKLGPGEGCDALVRQALRCLSSRGGVAALRQLDRPALLKLGDGQVLLIALDADSALLDAPGAPLRVPLLQLVARWRGELTTLWRTPPGWHAAEPPDAAYATWLSQRLAAIDGKTGDAGLYARIAVFQSAQGLVADGVAGPLTLIQINRASGIDEPRLAATSGSRPS